MTSSHALVLFLRPHFVTPSYYEKSIEIYNRLYTELNFAHVYPEITCWIVQRCPKVILYFDTCRVERVTYEKVER